MKNKLKFLYKTNRIKLHTLLKYIYNRIQFYFQRNSRGKNKKINNKVVGYL